MSTATVMRLALSLAFARAPHLDAPPSQASPPEAPATTAGADPGQASPADPEPTPDPAPAPDLAALEAALAALPSTPTLAEVQRAALRSAGVDAAAPIRWRRRVRAAAALPTLTLQYDHRLGQGWTLDQEAGSADALRNDGEYQSVVRARATWELDRLIYSPDELRVARSALDLDDWRTRVLVEVTKLYFERQRLLLERSLAAPGDLQTAMEIALRLRELEGLLSALTGLDFDRDPSAQGARR
ncbi:hypothetical protein G6O69_28710 [Pseudenhygromyxa sp. WMMC2535]|uniref:hypothetical protein n=1 Tax=Pseudenhygromyxa sp. WMMC2535 TaxID=2712867 RepID=UPI00155374EB|nr:hypothetical protein [Pseudenhygromyxa sp. WMMC2535]NVB41848.1 hypothetical protein [Pseudenhygromyxa sp. WMMC2535]